MRRRRIRRRRNDKHGPKPKLAIFAGTKSLFKPSKKNISTYVVVDQNWKFIFQEAKRKPLSLKFQT